jgi:acylphosphatase
MSEKAPESQLARIRLIVRGRVQGVGFRYAACDEAEALAVAGWVRNLANGSVEIVAEGARKDLQVLADWARRGPMYARVDEVSEEWLAAAGKLQGFDIR